MSRNHVRDEAAGSEAGDALREWFESRPVAELAGLRQALGASTRTVFRELGRAGYHSSFSHAGRYYTLAGTPQFDERGLWFHEQVGFSRHGTLRSTLVHLIEKAEAGATHDELRAVVRLRVHDTLRDLVAAGLVGRESFESLFVYLSATPSLAGAQMHRRREIAAARPSPPPSPLDAARVIDVLLAVIRKPRFSAPQIGSSLRLGGITVSDEQVEAIFARYGLGKKTAPSRFRRSRR